MASIEVKNISKIFDNKLVLKDLMLMMENYYLY